jgi:molybdate transport system regulatory protein
MMSLISVDVAGDVFSSIILEGKKGRVGYKKDEEVNIVFKETEVGIAKNLSGQISFRNRFAGWIRDIERGLILSKIILDYKGHVVESIISTQSADAMDLREDDIVEWLVKTNEVSLMPLHDER